MSKKNSATEESKNELVDVETRGGLALMPDFLGEGDFESDGFEGTDSDAYAIPFIQILQKMSPIVDEDSPKYINGAKAGMFLDTITQKLYDGKKGILIVPCAYKRSYIQWGGRDGDGGYKGEFTPEQYDEMVANKIIKVINGRGYMPDDKGNVNEKKSDYFADTRAHYVILLDEESGETSFAVMPLSGTLTKASRTLMTLLKQRKIQTPRGKLTPPSYANIVRATTIGMSNEKGNWSGVSFAIEGLVQDKLLFEEAKEFNKNINAGVIKADHQKAEYDSGSEDHTSEAQTAEDF